MLIQWFVNKLKTKSLIYQWRTIKPLELLSKNHKHKVDQQFVLRSHLFDVWVDVWVDDWDRHDDQWRWATFEKEGYTLYRPIPRDRDQVFLKAVTECSFIKAVAKRSPK